MRILQLMYYAYDGTLQDSELDERDRRAITILALRSKALDRRIEWMRKLQDGLHHFDTEMVYTTDHYNAYHKSIPEFERLINISVEDYKSNKESLLEELQQFEGKLLKVIDESGSVIYKLTHKNNDGLESKVTALRAIIEGYFAGRPDNQLSIKVAQLAAKEAAKSIRQAAKDAVMQRNKVNGLLDELNKIVELIGQCGDGPGSAYKMPFHPECSKMNLLNIMKYNPKLQMLKGALERFYHEHEDDTLKALVTQSVWTMLDLTATDEERWEAWDKLYAASQKPFSAKLASSLQMVAGAAFITSLTFVGIASLPISSAVAFSILFVAMLTGGSAVKGAKALGLWTSQSEVVRHSVGATCLELKTVMPVRPKIH